MGEALEDKMLTNDEQRQALWKHLAAIRSKWSLSDSLLADILHVDKATISRWNKNKSIPNSKSATFDLLVHFFALERSLSRMFSYDQDQFTWLTTNHPDFHEVPLEMMKKDIAGVIDVRRYLDFMRGLGA